MRLVTVIKIIGFYVKQTNSPQFAGPFFPKYYSGHQIKTNELAIKCSTYMTNRKCEILNRKLVMYVQYIYVLIGG